MSAPHAAVKHELLVRCLDAWAPAALHGHKRVTFVSSAEVAATIAAVRVFGEFADLLERHTLTVLVPDASVIPPLEEVAAEYGSPPGLVLMPWAGPLPPGSPIFGFFDSYGPEVPSLESVSTVATAKGAEVLLSVPPSVYPPYADALARAGLGLVCRVELVDASGEAEMLLFATSSEKTLEKFKDELWALDEYAGIRLRDPHDGDRTLLDISVQPPLGPLRRLLSARVVHTGGSTLAELRLWSLHETVFRAADATRAVQALVSAGAVTRDPATGRLSPDTVIRPR